MGQKSAAQIRRMEKRAAVRGETYVAPPRPPPRKRAAEDGDGKKKKKKKTKHQKYLGIAKRLEQKLKDIDDNSELTSKDRRSAKRKAEAMAAEDAEMSRTEFLEWCEKSKGGDSSPETKPEAVDEEANETKNDEDPKIILRQLAAAEKLVVELEAIDKQEDLNSKERRSAKRKAHAIAAEEIGMEAEALLEWYQNHNNKGVE
ncbi:MAG: hypothetical protein SGARI_007888 [Bacillariaceae sp.]